MSFNVCMHFKNRRINCSTLLWLTCCLWSHWFAVLVSFESFIYRLNLLIHRLICVNKICILIFYLHLRKIEILYFLESLEIPKLNFKSMMSASLSTNNWWSGLHWKVFLKISKAPHTKGNRWYEAKEMCRDHWKLLQLTFQIQNEAGENISQPHSLLVHFCLSGEKSLKEVNQETCNMHKSRNEIKGEAMRWLRRL